MGTCSGKPEDTVKRSGSTGPVIIPPTLGPPVRPPPLPPRPVKSPDVLVITSTTQPTLQTATYDNTTPFFPAFTEGKCVKVYDGDTIHLAAQVNNHLHRFAIRMYGYDSPELRTKNPEEKKAALAAKEALQQRIDGKIVRVSIVTKREKYGRLLAILYDQEGEINAWMIANHHGKPYFGGTKEVFQ